MMNILKNFKTTTSILLCIAFSPLAHAQIIDKINISGLHTIDRGTVLNYLPFESGDFYSQSVKQKIIDATLNTGFFKNVIVSDSGNTLNIEVIENPVIKDIIVEMESENLIELSKINENLDNGNISKGKVLNEEGLNKFVSKLREVYKNGGYADASIKYNIAIDSDNLATISLNINENKILKIQTMNIVGNNNFTTEDLLDLFDIGEADNALFNFFTKRDNFSQIALDGGIDKLTKFYLNNGYLDIKVNDVKKTKLADNKINITINISEGSIYHIGNISFKNNSILKDANLPSLLNVASGEIFKRSKVVAGIQSITDALADKGYAFTKVNSKTNKKIIAGKYFMDLEVSVDSNQKVYINRITIDGNTRTADEVIRREIGILEGGVYSDTQINKSITKLKRLGFFSNVSMKVSKVDGAKDRINLHFHIEETKTGQFSIGVSHSNATGIAFNTGIKEKNIFGSGNELNASISYSKAVQNIDVFFLDPYFTKEGHSLSYGIFSKKVDGSDLESSSYITNKTGLSLGYGVPINEDSRINASIKVSNTDVTCSGNFSSVGYEPEQCANDYSSEVYGSIGYTNNTLNNSVFPTDGDKLNITTGIALPFADYRYHKIDTSYKKYTPLSDKLTLKINGRIGVANGYGDRDLPFFERYYGGGASSVRGFSFNSLGEKYPDNTRKGGKFSILGSISVISPLSWVKDSENMRISAFIDVGGIGKKASFNGVKYRASLGLGFVWMTPVGPLGIYTATPLKKEDGDDTKNFDFTIGTSF